jgi:hypothetical protein
LTSSIYATQTLISTCTPLPEISFRSTGCFGVLAISVGLGSRAGIRHDSGVCELGAKTADLLDGVDNTIPGLERVDDKGLATSLF